MRRPSRGARCGPPSTGRCRRPRDGPRAAAAVDRTRRRPPACGKDGGHRRGDRGVDTVASQAGSVRALGDDPGLRGGAVVESRYTDATLMTEGATPGTNFGELRYGEVRRIRLPRTRVHRGA